MSPAGMLLVAAGFMLIASSATVLRAAAGRYNEPGRLPWGTLAVNIGGSFAAGLAVGWLGGPGGGVDAVLVGVAGLGSLTTFSGFARELTDAAAAHRWPLVATNLTLSLAGGVAAAVAGLALTG
jgi:fluoride exporter